MAGKGEEVVNMWRADWNAFIRDAFGVRLDKEQQSIVTAVQHHKRVAVASGTARGKDFVAACCALSFLYLTPRWRRLPSGEVVLAENTKVALTAPTDRQVKNIMMPEISRLFSRAKGRGVVLPGRLNAYDIRTDSPEWFLTGFKADEYNHEAWSGFHAVNTMFVITEASGISDDTFSAIEGNLQGNSRLLLVFNPNTPVGYAARAMKSPRFHRFRLNSLNAENVTTRQNIIPGQVDYEWVRDKVDNWCSPIQKNEVQPDEDDFEFEGGWYRPSDLFRIKVLGKFPKVSQDTLIPPSWVELAMKRWREAHGQAPQDPQTHVLGVDVAGMGRDATVYVERRDNYVHEIRANHSGGRADHMRIAGQIVAERRSKPDMYVSIDTIGEGAGVYARACEVDGSDRILSCKYSEGAKRDGRDLTDITGEYTFANMRAYLFWAVRDWLDPRNDTGAMLPPDDELLQELSEPRWAFQSNGKIIIESKEEIRKRLGRSTDKLDALANTFYPLDTFVPIDFAALSKII